MLRGCGGLVLRSWPLPSSACLTVRQEHRSSDQKENNASSSSPSSSGVLSGIRVLDLSRVVAGPFCTQFLADMGAEVLKVERPVTGDETRAFGPPFVCTKDGNDGHEDETQTASYFFAVNRNKSSVAIDLKSGGGLVSQLVRQCDVLIENFTPGVMDKLGLSFDSMSAVNESLIYCSISGFGSDSRRAGYDVIASSVAGLLSLTGPEDGEPCRPGVPVVDIITGLYAASAILTALFKRQQQEMRGQRAAAVKIETDLISSQVSILIHVALNFLNFGQEAVRRGSAHDSIVPYQSFACRRRGTGDEDWVTVGAGTDAMFAALIRSLFSDDEEKVSQILSDPRFRRNSDRVEHRYELIGMLQQQFRTRSQAEWLRLFEGKAFSYGPVNRLSQVFADERILKRNVFRVSDDEEDGSHQGKSYRLLKNAVRFKSQDDFFRSHTRLPPLKVGQDTQSVLKRLLNMSDEQIFALKKAGVIDFPGT